uniref:Chitinase homolog LP6 (lp6) protein n=1 Tax=Pinus taeda TaxID=3352 RepID=V9GZU3_PINTA|nr:hypothetical protein a2 - loblolly pine [Pinus taeda]AAA75098.1 uORFa2; Method: conceptual translation supplied by author [Pinus taeda]
MLWFDLTIWKSGAITKVCPV